MGWQKRENRNRKPSIFPWNILEVSCNVSLKPINYPSYPINEMSQYDHQMCSWHRCVYGNINQPIDSTTQPLWQLGLAMPRRTPTSRRGRRRHYFWRRARIRRGETWRDVAQMLFLALVFVKGQEMVSSGLWWLMVAYDGFWRFLMVYDEYMIVSDGFRWFMMRYIYIYTYWISMIYRDIIWHD